MPSVVLAQEEDIIIAAQLGPGVIQFGICYLSITEEEHPRLQIVVQDNIPAGVGTDYGVYLFYYFSISDDCHTCLCNVYRSTIIKEIYLESDES